MNESITHATQKAGFTMDVTVAMLESATFDMRAQLHADMNKALDEFIGERQSISETQFREEEWVMSSPVYPIDANFDDPDLEPIGWEAVPMVKFFATRMYLADR